MAFTANSEFLTQEDNEFQQEIKKVQEWFKSDRFRLAKRPYSAKDGNYSPFSPFSTLPTYLSTHPSTIYA